MKLFLIIAGFLILFLVEIARVYFIMPFPGSQQANTIDLAYFIQHYIWLFRTLGILMITWPVASYLLKGTWRARIAVGFFLVLFFVVFGMINFKFLADKMFYQPTQTILSPVSESKVGQHQLVLGVTVNGESKAYPIEIIGYHHQVRDIVGGQQIMVTYCTVCRTGRVFSPTVNGTLETFRLVGMDHFNAMFEDLTTRSWWRQVSGEAIAGPLKGTLLPEIPSEQMSLSSWISLHPKTLVLQEDPVFDKEYRAMGKYDEGKNTGALTRHDTASWKEKSWVVGLTQGMYARAYDWKELSKIHIINDKMDGVPVVVALQGDSVSFHAWNRIVNNDTLTFRYDGDRGVLVSEKNGSLWDWSGECIDGAEKGSRLKSIQAYQEYWHSWRTFHPLTTQYLPAEKKSGKLAI